MNYYIYFLTNAHNTTLYVGVTNNLVRRVYEHRNRLDSHSFSARYNLDKLVYYEIAADPYHAIEREKQIKTWNRKRKEKLIQNQNPNWVDLYPSILG